MRINSHVFCCIPSPHCRAARFPSSSYLLLHPVKQPSWLDFFFKFPTRFSNCRETSIFPCACVQLARKLPSNHTPASTHTVPRHPTSLTELFCNVQSSAPRSISLGSSMPNYIIQNSKVIPWKSSSFSKLHPKHILGCLAPCFGSSPLSRCLGSFSLFW